jgi:hypothetical protein
VWAHYYAEDGSKNYLVYVELGEIQIARDVAKSMEDLFFDQKRNGRELDGEGHGFEFHSDGLG